MSTYYGQAGDVLAIPSYPNSVAITSSTNATPIVVTTSGAHGLQTGQFVMIYGHATNTAANGVWKATVLSGTTYSLATVLGVAAAGVAIGSGGASQSIGIPGITLPEDAVTDRDAASVNVPLEALADMVALLAYRVYAAGQVLPGGRQRFDGARLLLAGGSRLNVTATRKTDADHTISPGSDGPVYILAKPTAVRTITIDQASDVLKEDNDTLEFYMPIPPTADPAGAHYRFRREGSGNNIAILSGKYFPTAGALDCYPGFCRIQLEGGVWRLGGGAGVNWDTDS